MSNSDVISIKDYFNEKFTELKHSIHDLKREIQTNQTDVQAKIINMEHEIDQKIEKIQQDVSEILFIKKYWKVFAIALILFGMTTIYTVKKQLTNENNRSSVENVVSK